MFGYHLSIAVRGLRRNTVLTVLMVTAIGVGIGTSMTSLAVFRAMSSDPIPQKSHRLFVAQIDNWGPNKPGDQNEDQLEEYDSYIDAMAFMNLHAAKHQTAIYTTVLKGRSADPKIKPFSILIPAVYADFFPMFDAPFKFGAPWTSADDEAAVPVAVISSRFNNELFGGVNSVGRTFTLAGATYRVTGVLDRWPLVPRFYDLHTYPYSTIDEIFIPFSRAVAVHAESISGTSCKDPTPPGWDAFLQSDCVWIQVWAELDSAAEVVNYRTVLNNYAADQQRTGRFHWPAHTQLRDVNQWLQYRDVTPRDLGILTFASFGFLFVCVVNAAGLMLARTMARSHVIGVRRALGASRKTIVAQYLVETAAIGICGALIGLTLTVAGLLAMRAVLSREFAGLTYLNATAIGTEIVVALCVTIIAGLYPTWRAASVQPALQLKAE